jgi:putative membrane protein
MLKPIIKVNDKKANILILIVSVIVFVVVAILGKEKPEMKLSFDVHIFATINAVLNSAVAILLVAALIMVKQKKYTIHRNMMMAAMGLSALFLVSYIAHHLLGGETKFGDTNFDNMVSDTEKAAVGSLRTVYFIILSTHILLAAIILPFILKTTYRALTGEFDKHKKIAKLTWPIWFYVAVTGPVVYWMISPYYN